jgi:hypothetical protein
MEESRSLSRLGIGLVEGVGEGEVCRWRKFEDSSFSTSNSEVVTSLGQSHASFHLPEISLELFTCCLSACNSRLKSPVSDEPAGA